MTIDIAATARLLARARQQGRRVLLPPEQRPTSSTEAYAIQDAVAAAIGASTPPPAWKVGAPDQATEPSAAPIYELLSSPARVAAARMTMLGIEAEIALVFERALPARPQPYADDEVLDAVRELRVAIELCDSRIENWENADDVTKLSDHQLNFALVTGDASTRVHDVDFRSLSVCTRVDGTIIKQGTGSHALDNPLSLLPWLANHARTRGGIEPGTVVTTGAWLGLHRVDPGSTVVVEFCGIGRAQVCLTL